MSRKAVSALAVLLVLCALPARAGPLPPPHLGYGVLLGNIGNASRVPGMGFEWIESFVYWMSVEPAPSSYTWDDVHNIVDAAGVHQLHVLIRIGGWQPGGSSWALDTSAAGACEGEVDYPVHATYLPHFQSFAQALAAEVRAYIDAKGYSSQVAYQVWNEPNIDREWGCQPVDPAAYASLLSHAYAGLKAGDPQAIVVTAGLAPTGGWPDRRAMNDVDFLQAMYASGQLAGRFDALAIHNYGFACAPEAETCGGSPILTFRRAEDHYAVLLEHGDGDKQVWATEYGWLHDPAEFGVANCLPADFQWMILPQHTVADYVVRSFEYADANWPWMGPMFVSNFDFATIWPMWGWCEPMVWYSLLNPDLPGGVLDPRPAYTALKDMPKRPASLGPRMALAPAALSLMAAYELPITWTMPVYVNNAGYGTFTWTVQLPSGSSLWMGGVSPTQGTAGQAFTVSLSSLGYAAGTYTASLVVNAYPIGSVAGSPYTLPIRLRVLASPQRVYLPLALRAG